MRASRDRAFVLWDHIISVLAEWQLYIVPTMLHVTGESHESRFLRYWSTPRCVPHVAPILFPPLLPIFPIYDGLTSWYINLYKVPRLFPSIIYICWMSVSFFLFSSSSSSFCRNRNNTFDQDYFSKLDLNVILRKNWNDSRFMSHTLESNYSKFKFQM